MKMKYIKALLLPVAALGLAACTYDPYKTDIPAVEYSLELTSSAEAIVVTEANLDDVAVTFEWTPAREMPEGYTVKYSTELDVVGNNFGENTTVKNEENDGTFKRSFTFGDIQKYLDEKWTKVPVNKAFTLEFRVHAAISGPTFEAPEVGKVTVDATPLTKTYPKADKISLAGTAVEKETEISKTKENTDLYAWYGDLKAGNLELTALYREANQWLSPSQGGALQDGQKEDVNMSLEKESWTIPADGKYRVVVDTKNWDVTIYSEAKDIKPLEVECEDGSSIQITDLYINDPDAKYEEDKVRKMKCSVSEADPRVLTWEGSLKGRINFAAGVQEGDDTVLKYYFTCLLKDNSSQDFEIEFKDDKKTVETDIQGGHGEENKNSFFVFGLNDKGEYGDVKCSIVFDLAKNKVIFTKK